jgi:hypothetical protein
MSCEFASRREPYGPRDRHRSAVTDRELRSDSADEKAAELVL